MMIHLTDNTWPYFFLMHFQFLKLHQGPVFNPHLTSFCPSSDRTLEAPGVKERKLAGWGLSRGKTWKGSLNVTRKKKRPPNGSQHGHVGGRAHDETFFFMLYLKAIKATQMEW